MMQTAIGIVREEGATKLWQGITPALYRHVVYRCVELVIIFSFLLNKILHFQWCPDCDL